jgi:hypothetical protein
MSSFSARSQRGLETMCSLCGILGAEGHWTDLVADAGAAEAGPASGTSRQERLRRCALANRVLAHYRIRLADFEGRNYVLRAATGRSELVPDLAGVWAAAERLAGRPCDPLDPALIAALERG